MGRRTGHRVLGVLCHCATAAAAAAAASDADATQLYRDPYAVVWRADVWLIRTTSSRIAVNNSRSYIIYMSMPQKELKYDSMYRHTNQPL